MSLTLFVLWTGVLFVIALPPYFHLHHHFPLWQNKQPLEHHPIIQHSGQSNISLLTIIPFLKNSISHHPDVDDFFRLFRFHLAPWLWDRHGPQITNSCVSAMVASPSAPLDLWFRHVLHVFFPTVIVWTKEKGIPMLLTSRSRFAMLCPIFFGGGRYRKMKNLLQKRTASAWQGAIGEFVDIGEVPDATLIIKSSANPATRPPKVGMIQGGSLCHWDLGTTQLKPCQVKAFPPPDWVALGTMPAWEPNEPTPI